MWLFSYSFWNAGPAASAARKIHSIGEQSQGQENFPGMLFSNLQRVQVRYPKSLNFGYCI